MASRTLVAKCHCEAVHFSITVPVSALPLGVHLCHCSVCRTTHGTYTCFHAPLPDGVRPVFAAPSSLEGSTTGYRHAKAACTRYFCKTCGCHIGDDDYEEGKAIENPGWRIASSLFGHGLHDDGSPDQAFMLRSHALTNSAPSGFHEWLPTLGSRTLPKWNPKPGDAFYPPATDIPYEPNDPEYDADGREVLRAECHCGGVSFTIARPADCTGEMASRSPKLPDRWLACLDTCDDCRLVDGAHVIGWGEVPLASLVPKVTADLELGTLKRYQSSKGAMRAFCSVCGATVFFRNLETSASNVDVATGLLRAPEGVTAHRWLHWRHGRIVYPESGQRYHADFTNSLITGFRVWAAKTYNEEQVSEAS
ncbi:hypothetical protein SBRCBS47491_000592 [Sporothrix bragantina]|uniref:CENP-V/GFA domain-containing protein n=1 Tax=Sporothrix bragantina TaxID=671064 RepID=A0ABP0ART3_9PEZI